MRNQSQIGDNLYEYIDPKDDSKEQNSVSDIMNSNTRRGNPQIEDNEYEYIESRGNIGMHNYESVGPSQYECKYSRIS